MKSEIRTKETAFTGIGWSTDDREKCNPCVNWCDPDGTGTTDEKYRCTQTCPFGDGETGCTDPSCPRHFEEDVQ